MTYLKTNLLNPENAKLYSFLLITPCFFIPFGTLLPWVAGLTFAHYLLSFYYARNIWSQQPLPEKISVAVLSLAALLSFSIWGPKYLNVMFGIHWALTESLLELQGKKQSSWHHLRFLLYCLIFFRFAYPIYDSSTEAIFLGSLFLLFSWLQIQSKGRLTSVQRLMDFIYFGLLCLVIFTGKPWAELPLIMVLYHVFVWLLFPSLTFLMKKESKELGKFLQLNFVLTGLSTALCVYIASGGPIQFNMLAFEFYRWAAAHAMSSAFLSRTNLYFTYRGRSLR